MGSGISQPNNRERDKQIMLSVTKDHDNIKNSSWFSYLYARYLPSIVVERFKLENSEPLIGPERHIFPAACAFVDISGFTKLSEKLVQEYGVNGAEMLNKFISGYFDLLIKVILDWGGDIIKFAGDAILVIWRNPNYVESDIELLDEEPIDIQLDSQYESLAHLLLRAIGCNLTLLSTLNNFSPMEGISLSLHTGLGVGYMSGFFVGGVQENWEFFVAGSPIQQMADAGEEAKSGEVIISSEAYDLVRSTVSGALKPSGNFLVTSITNMPNFSKRQPINIPQSLENSLLNFIPKLVRRRVEAGQSAEWINEYRRVFIMFVKLPAIDYSDPEVITILQAAVCSVQESIFNFEGTIARLLADDKGTRFKIAFGMPTNSHEDDGERVVLAAIDIQKRLVALPNPTPASIGIACGTLFCGEAGSSRRCEYTAVGYKVNLAARLMQAAGDGILVDQITYDVARARDIQFDILAPIRVKGMAQPVPIFKPLGKYEGTDLKDDDDEYEIINKSDKPTNLRKIAILNNHRIDKEEVRLIGRSAEKKFIKDMLSKLKSEDCKTCLFIEGEGGIGKTALIINSIGVADTLNLNVYVGVGTLLERSTPFFPFRSIFELLMNFDNSNIPHRTAAIAPLLTNFEEPDVRCLLNKILNLTFPESEYTKKMADDTRGKITRSLLISIFNQRCEDSKNVIVIEDLCWMDSSSWALLFEMVRNLNNSSFILTSRPFSLPYPADYIHLMRFPQVKKISLELMNRDDTLKLALSKLKVTNIPLFLQALLYEKAKGHPLYLQEVLRRLLESKMISVNLSGECIITETFSEAEVSKFPDSVEDVIVDRIDSLPPGPELTIKVCGVIGKQFTLRLLADVHPTAPSTVALRNDLKYLIESGFILQEGVIEEKNDVSFVFRNGFFQEVAYNLLLVAQRKQIHKNIAEYYAANYPEHELSIFYALLAYHYEKAEEWWFALDYAEKAASQGAKMHSNGEVCLYYRTAIRLLRKFPLDGPILISSLSNNASFNNNSGIRRKSTLANKINPAAAFLQNSGRENIFTSPVNQYSQDNVKSPLNKFSNSFSATDTHTPPPRAEESKDDDYDAPYIENIEVLPKSRSSIGPSVDGMHQPENGISRSSTANKIDGIDSTNNIKQDFLLPPKPYFIRQNSNDGTGSCRSTAPNLNPTLIPPVDDDYNLNTPERRRSMLHSTALVTPGYHANSNSIEPFDSTNNKRKDLLDFHSKDLNVEELTAITQSMKNSILIATDGDNPEQLGHRFSTAIEKSNQAGIRSMLNLRGHTPQNSSAPLIADLHKRIGSIDQTPLFDSKGSNGAFQHSSTINFKKGLLTEGGADGPTIKQRLETCYVNLAEALFSSGRYTEATINFEMCNEILPENDYLSVHLYLLAKRLGVRHSFSMKQTIPNNLFELTRIAKLLLRYASAVSFASTSESILAANYACLRAVDIADCIDNCFVTCYAYGQAAYYSLLKNEDNSLASSFYQKASLALINQESEMSPIETAICRMRLAHYCTAIGDVAQAKAYAEEAHIVFVNAHSHRKYRECLYMQSLLHYVSGELRMAKTSFENLLTIAIDDDDIHMECESRKWISILDMTMKGAADMNIEHLDTTRAVYKDLGKTDFALDVIAAMNDFYRTLDGKLLIELFETINASLSKSSASNSNSGMPPPFALTKNGFPVVTDWAQSLNFVIAAILLLDAATLCSSDASARRHVLMNLSTIILNNLLQLSKTFPLLIPFYSWLDGKYTWLQYINNTSGLVSTAVMSFPARSLTNISTIGVAQSRRVSVFRATTVSSSELIALADKASSCFESSLKEGSFRGLNLLRGYTLYSLYEMHNNLKDNPIVRPSIWSMFGCVSNPQDAYVVPPPVSSPQAISSPLSLASQGHHRKPSSFSISKRDSVQSDHGTTINSPNGEHKRKLSSSLPSSRTMSLSRRASRSFKAASFKKTTSFISDALVDVDEKGLHVDYRNGAENILFSCGVEYFHHPSFPSLFATDYATLHKFGIGDTYLNSPKPATGVVLSRKISQSNNKRRSSIILDHADYSEVPLPDISMASPSSKIRGDVSTPPPPNSNSNLFVPAGNSPWLKKRNLTPNKDSIIISKNLALYKTSSLEEAVSKNPNSIDLLLVKR